jgi:hypothetical protein
MLKERKREKVWPTYFDVWACFCLKRLMLCCKAKKKKMTISVVIGLIKYSSGCQYTVTSKAQTLNYVKRK